MNPDRLEDLPVWREAGLRDRIKRATISISNVTRERKEILQQLRRIQEEDIARSRGFSRKNQ